MDRAEAAGQALAGRHREPAEADPTASLLNFAESPRADDWTLRSALVRFAQPEPTRAGAVLELVRRVGSALHPLSATVERHTVSCSRSLTLDDLVVTDGSPGAASSPESYPDGRVADVARIQTGFPDAADAFLAGYRSELDLEPDEEAALALLPAAVRLDGLGDVLARWAKTAADDPPIDAVDSTCEIVFELLNDLGVPRQTAPPRRGRPGR